jgi:N-acetylglucosaminyl-diphospho-decaprenol L-rhamnosyltransferase
MTPIAICIVAFRNADEIARCLEAVSRSDFAGYEVVICENGGPDAYAALRAAVPERLSGGQAVTALDGGGNLGYAGGVNRCMEARPDARAWWVLNPDTRPEPGALSALVRRLERGDCAAAGGVLYHPDGRVQAYGGRWRPLLARAESIGHGTPLSYQPDAAMVERDMNYLLGASMLIGRAMVERVGLMRDDYFLYAEEIEWCLRAGAAGLKLGFAPDAMVCHGQGGTTGSADAITTRPKLPIYLDERNKLNIVRDTTPALLPVAAVSALALSFGRFARRGAWAQQRHALGGWWAGLRNRRGMPDWMR